MAKNKNIIIDDFTGMSDKGLFWLEGGEIKHINNNPVISPGGRITSDLTSDDISGFQGLADMDVIPIPDDDDRATSAEIYNIGIGTDKIVAWGDDNKGILHDIPTNLNNKGAITSSIQGSILYTVEDTYQNGTLGVGWVGACDDGSSTTKIIDTDGRDFTTLGVSTSAGSNQVRNTTTNTTFTITSITTTNSTNDTLNFTAGTANSEYDQFFVFVDDRFDFFTTADRKQFSLQETPYRWQRQILVLDDFFYILNGNYIAKLSIDESTWTSDVLDDDYKQLPLNTQSTCFSSNNKNILVGGEFKGKGRLMVWNGWINAWNNIIEIDAPPISMLAYKTGWIVLITNTLYFTDGYSISKMSSYPRTDNDNNLTDNANFMTMLGDSVYINSRTAGSRARTGVLRYNKNNGWLYIPYTDENGKLNYQSDGIGALLSRPDENEVHVSYKTGSTHKETIGRVRPENSYRTSVILYMTLPENKTVSKIKLNVLANIFKGVNNDKDTTITINYGKGKIPPSGSTQISSSSTTTKLYNGSGASYKGTKGQKILMMDGDTSGEITYITDIANAGTNSEEWTVSPALSVNQSNNAEVRMYDLFLTQSKVINNYGIENDITFIIPTFYSNNLYLEILMESDNAIPLSIRKIELI